MDILYLIFLVSPFEYNAIDKTLYFHEKVSLSLNLDICSTRTSDFSYRGKNVYDIVKNIVFNREDIDDIGISTSSASSENATDTIDYLIVTSNALSSYFQPIAQWKRTKGLNTKIITIEDIEDNYSGKTTPQKIKSCLYDLYRHNSLKYVLLGGDDMVVPVKSCYVSVADEKEEAMPTDLYYACFGGSFDWDGNSNGIFGETTDNIDLAPSIYVTRLPIRTATDINAYTTKLLEYEKTPTKYGWNNNILMSGTKLWTFYSSTQSDAEAKGDNLYSTFIQPYWDGSRKKFYDTYTDFAGGADYVLNPANLQTQLSRGYTFFDIATHGNPTAWSLESGRYTTSYAGQMANNGFTIITTMACQTNQFDSNTDEPCLSEALIRNKNNGIVAYLGCSRYGWGYRDTNRLGPSLQYEAQFYKNLFTTSIENKHYGEMVAASKIEMISLCGSNNAFRWVQFGLNPIGDPEMPIFTTSPSIFSNVTTCFDNTDLKINTNVDGCTICVMSISDNGESYYNVQKNVKEATFSKVSGNVSVCITKQNYIPYVKELSNVMYIQNETISKDSAYNADVIKIGSKVTSSRAQGPVTFASGTIDLKAGSIVIEPETIVSKDVNLTLSNE